MSKGSKPRPRVVSNEEYKSRWDAIFAKDKPAEPKPEPEKLEQEQPNALK